MVLCCDRCICFLEMSPTECFIRLKIGSHINNVFVLLSWILDRWRVHRLTCLTGPLVRVLVLYCTLKSSLSAYLILFSGTRGEKLKKMENQISLYNLKLMSPLTQKTVIRDQSESCRYLYGTWLERHKPPSVVSVALSRPTCMGEKVAEEDGLDSVVDNRFT